MGTLNRGLQRQFDDIQNQGGLKSIYIIDKDNVSSLTPGSGGTAQAITWTLASITAGTVTFTLNGTTYSQAYSSSAAGTVTAFVAAFATAFAGQGVTLTDGGSADMTLTAIEAGVPFTANAISAGTGGTWTSSSPTANVVDATHTFTALVPVNAAAFEEVQCEIQTAQFTYDVKGVGAVGARSYVETKLEMYFPRPTQANIKFLSDVKNGCGYIFKIAHYTGESVIAGYDQKMGNEAAMYMTDVKYDSAKDPSGMAGFTVAFTGKQVEIPYSSTI